MSSNEQENLKSTFQQDEVVLLWASLKNNIFQDFGIQAGYRPVILC